MNSPLSSIEAFASLSEAILQQIENLAVRKVLPRGQLLYSEGEPAEQIYILVSGRLRLFSSNDAGKEYVLGFIEPGMSWGEGAMLMGEPRLVSAIAEEDCDLKVIYRRDYQALLDAHPEIKDQMLVAAYRTIKHLAETVKNLALMDVYGRVRLLLESLAVDQGDVQVVSESLTQQAIAERVGASREMIAKIMKELVFGGYVRIEQRQIVLLQRLPERF
ncbi:Crp/Fnr family transcriptional regulator [Chitinilyticum aquatile]|uniref:Crp/Fnr family transcriptional regulator n=1 Tax=Chitinilyticum aquatile TaxID=362520 RepID=UPI0004280106|nr:Crp/Fnr family transcriptional regulator [Chitinilyticum aquatile]